MAVREFRAARHALYRVAIAVVHKAWLPRVRRLLGVRGGNVTPGRGADLFIRIRSPRVPEIRRVLLDACFRPRDLRKRHTSDERR